MIGPFKRRSSWPSSFATAFIGWIASSLLLPITVQGAIAGALTFLVTSAAGRTLAAAERRR